MQKYSAGRWNDEMRAIGDLTSANTEAYRIEHIKWCGHRGAFGQFWRSEIIKYCQKSSILVIIGIHCTQFLFSFFSMKTWKYLLKFRFSEKHSPESVLHFDDLMQLLNIYETINVFLLVAPSQKQVVERFCEYIANDENRLRRLIVCSRSPILIYQVRKLLFFEFDTQLKAEKSNWHMYNSTCNLALYFLHFLFILHFNRPFPVAQGKSEFNLWPLVGWDVQSKITVADFKFIDICICIWHSIPECNCVRHRHQCGIHQ